MKTLIAIALLLLLGLSGTLLAVPALAEGPAATNLDLTASPEAAVGQQFTLQARVTDDAQAPVPGVQVVFTSALTFLNTDSEVEFGRATTNAQGIATLSYIPRTEGTVPVSATFAGSARYAGSNATSEVLFKDGPQQFHQEIGLKVPGVGVWMLVLLMAGVWGTFLWALRQVRTIFQDGQKVAASEWGRHHV
ncbi:MAG: Ig-like domain repeat protein [Chloroflexi bacterium]|nr:Ig-like domain repeat protein [Chloroflexota bacterium]